MHPDVRLNEQEAAKLFSLMTDALSQIVADVQNGGPHLKVIWA